MRYADRSTPAGSGSNRRPRGARRPPGPRRAAARRARRAARGRAAAAPVRRARPGARRRAARRSSRSASRPARSIERSAARAWSGRVSKTSSAAAACTTITDDAVGDHVVQLARDARLLVGDRAARLPPRSPPGGCARPRRAPRAPTARAIANVVSSTVRREEVRGGHRQQPASHGIDTRGGRAAATDPIANSPATGKHGLRDEQQKPRPATRVIAITSSGRRRRQWSAPPWTTARARPRARCPARGPRIVELVERDQREEQAHPQGTARSPRRASRRRETRAICRSSPIAPATASVRRVIRGSADNHEIESTVLPWVSPGPKSQDGARVRAPASVPGQAVARVPRQLGDVHLRLLQLARCSPSSSTATE